MRKRSHLSFALLLAVVALLVPSKSLYDNLTRPKALLHLSYPDNLTLVSPDIRGNTASASFQVDLGVQTLVFFDGKRHFAKTVNIEGGGEIYQAIELPELTLVDTWKEAE